MPIQLPSLHGKVDPTIARFLRELTDGLNALEGERGAGAAAATFEARIAGLRTEVAAAQAEIALLRQGRVIAGGGGGGTTVSVDPTGALAGNGSITLPLAVRVDGVSVMIDGSNQLTAPAAVGGITQLTGDVTAGPGSGSQAATIATDAVTNAKLANMAALTAKVRAANSVGDPSDVALTDGHAAKRVGSAITSGGFGPVSVSVLTSGTGATYTVPAGIYRLRVRVQGPGGGGGGADQSGAGSGAGAGGGAGGYAEKVYSTTPAATFTYTIGTGGAGGVAGNNAGSNGSTATVFDSGGSPVTGNVGNGGGSMAAGTTLNGAAGGAGGTATGGDINITGQTGDSGIRWETAIIAGGRGGSSQLGRGGHWITNGGNGPNATGYGAGGAGISEYAGQTDRAGGAGAAGVIIVEEYN